LAALLLGIVLSIVLSWRFTKPLQLMRNNAERIAERDYDARNNLTQRDEIGELARSLDVMAERLQVADVESQKLEKLRREFIANISHELRTPVTVIRGSLEALRDGVITEKDDVDEFYEQMYKESLYLQRLINDLLDLSRLQNTDFPIEKAPLNLCSVVQDAVRSSRRLGMEKELRISAVLDSELYMLNGDYGRLRQMLLIFLHNSIKFSPARSTIEVRLERDRLRIIDHGCGMQAEDVAHAFDRFYKSRDEQNKSGSGLGLAIAKQIALRHDMVLELASTPGEGTVITVCLPRQIKGDAHDDEKA
jgi:signal transduction histidine kinase